MADEGTAPIAAPAPEYPGVAFPTVFADGVSSMANSPAIVKFYLNRFDPDFHSGGSSKPQPFAQVIMPMLGFAASFCFFESRIKVFLEQGYITQEQLDQFRKTLEEGG